MECDSIFRFSYNDPVFGLLKVLILSYFKGLSLINLLFVVYMA